MPILQRVTIEDFRCFRDKQTVTLAPITLLVGENSTGKTSFLAFLRALSDIAFKGVTPNFKQPYDLGSFDEIAHHRGSRGSRAESFSGGLTASVSDSLLREKVESGTESTVEFEVSFGRESNGTAPSPIGQKITLGDKLIEETLGKDGQAYEARIRTRRGEWEISVPTGTAFPAELGAFRFYTFAQTRRDDLFDDPDERPPQVSVVGDSPKFVEEDHDSLHALNRFGAGNSLLLLSNLSPFQQAEPFASAPVRSQPLRTYDPRKWERGPGGDYVPMRMAELSSFQPTRWKSLKQELERFGRASGLFDEIKVQHLGTTGSDPFQLQVRKGSNRLKGPFRNIVDVGYGVNQALPIITELLSPSEPTDLFLFQQPEVHLHPSAQAALGSLLCEIATDQVQLVVETHSDHLIDRIRMDVRDGKCDLTPDQVRILYFEREGLDVRIHEVWWDESGNIANAPPGYRRFFMQEVERSLWPPD